jgi:uncharacterized protein
MEKIIIELLKKRTGIAEQSIKNTSKLLEEGATIPFIARYRKEMTGSLDEVEINNISTELKKIRQLIARKEYIANIIEEQGKLSEALKTKIQNCWEDNLLEDIYLPYKKKRKTKATIAKEKGLEPLAKNIIDQRSRNLRAEAKAFINKEVSSVDETLEGARHIIAEWINENTASRSVVRALFQQSAIITSKLVKKKIAEAEKFKDYFDFSESVKRIPSHRALAIFRGEQENLLKVSIEIDNESAIDRLCRKHIRYDDEAGEQIELAIIDCLKRLMMPSLENESRKQLKEKSDIAAIEVFSENLKQLLLEPPLGEKNVLALDPGFRTGCKLVVLNQSGDLVYNTTVYPHPPQSERQKTETILLQLVKKYKVEAIAIGNGTAGKETYSFLRDINFPEEPLLFLINESGASIYSASAIAREEFPDLDLTVRGAISIGRRLMDPLAELIKIDAKSIGVGQYQHDVQQSLLSESLDSSVISAVNKVGVNLNTASAKLLSYISGLGPSLAKNIVQYRNENGMFHSRAEMLKVPRMGKKAYEQCAGFLKVKNGKNILDDTSVHPERYKLVKQMAKDINLPLDKLIANKANIDAIPLNNYIHDDIGMPTLRDIVKELEKPGVDPRGETKVFHFAEGINSIEDLSTGMILPGKINNITKFGAFVDLGIKESGLVHISQIVNRFIKDPAEVLKLNQEVQVKVTEIDITRKRISLTMKHLSL